MNELLEVQDESLARFGVLQRSFELINILIRKNVAQFERRSTPRACEEGLQLARSHFRRQFGLQVSLSIQLARVDVALAQGVVSLEDHAIGRNLLVVLQNDDVSDLQVGRYRVLLNNLLSAPIHVDPLNSLIVDLPVTPPPAEVRDQLEDHAHENDPDYWDEACERRVRGNGGDALEAPVDDEEPVDHALELLKERQWEERD